MPLQAAKQLLGDLIHYSHGRKHEDEDETQIVNFIHAVGSWKVMPLESLTLEQKQLLASVINRKDQGDHPMATPEGLKFFQPLYVGYCLGSVDPKTLSDTGLRIYKEVVEIFFNITDEVPRVPSAGGDPN